MRNAFSLVLSLVIFASHPLQAGITKDMFHLDSIKPDPTGRATEFKPTQTSFQTAELVRRAVKEILKENTAFRGEVGFSRQGRAISAYYFPGKSQKRALIIGGVHGSELSAIEIARKMVADLEKENHSYYSVIIIPCLFPDNEVLALQPADKKKKVYNLGRYTHKDAIDPNRQMPALGKPFNYLDPRDHLGRDIEHENQILLRLIEEFKPHRIANIHAIRDVRQAGIFADPRTDSEGYALGFETDSSLAVQMAKFIYENGGNVAGNRLDSVPTALYYNDPIIARPGEWQPRNLKGSAVPGDRGQGVSLGSWATTAVCDSAHIEKSRQPIRLITVEYPGYKRPVDYTTISEQEYHKQLVELYAAAIQSVFLGPYFEEETMNGCDGIKKTVSEKLLTGMN